MNEQKNFKRIQAFENMFLSDLYGRHINTISSKNITFRNCSGFIIVDRIVQILILLLKFV